MPDIFNEKKRLREQMRAARKGNPVNNLASFQKLRDMFVKNVSLPEYAVISSYCAFSEEMDPAPLLDHLRGQGYAIALPVVTGKALPLSFHLYEPGDVLRANSMGISEPLPATPIVEPDVMLVPLLGFDAARNRLGYGGGFYDRTISSLRAKKKITAFGIGYAYQELLSIPTGPHDVQLDKIVTEIKVF